MIEDWIVVTGGVVAVVVIMAAAVLRLRSTEQRMTEISYKLKVYTDLLNAITELNLASGDAYKMESAKKHLALTLNRLNLIGSSGVLKSTSDLLDFLNEHKDREYDTIRLHNILNTIVIEARRDLNPRHARRIEESNVRYRFFAPPKPK